LSLIAIKVAVWAGLQKLDSADREDNDRHDREEIETGWASGQWLEETLGVLVSKQEEVSYWFKDTENEEDRSGTEPSSVLPF
jgi:hypothetical protein